MKFQAHDSEENPFAESMAKIANSAAVPYLGDKAVVEAMLRRVIKEVFDGIQDYEGKASEVVVQVGRRAMMPFFGDDPAYAIVDGWNKRGVIDAFVSKWTGYVDPDPLMVMVGAFFDLVVKMFDAETYSQQPGVTPEQWQTQAQAAIDRLSWILMGVTPAQQMDMAPVGPSLSAERSVP
jgi:hypothetical protein